MKKILLLIILAWLALPLSLMAQEVKAVSFNVRNSISSREDGKNNWYNRSKAVVNMIRKEHPMVMGVQEALLDQLAYIDNNFRRQYRRVGVGRDNGISRGEFTAIFYDYHQVELVSQKTRWLSSTPTRLSRGWDAACNRTVTIARFRIKSTGKEFYYFNTHLDHVGAQSREESVKLIAQLIMTETRGIIPVIVGGDLNCVITDPILDPFFDMGLISARLEAPVTDNKYSYNGYGKDRWMVDHFLTRGVVLKSFRTLTDNYGARYISDHYPIEIIFTIE